MNKILWRVLISAVVLLAMIFLMILIFQPNKTDVEGEVTIKVANLSGEIIQEKIIEYEAGATLKGLLEDNFANVVVESGLLMKIESLETPSDWSTYICIYINGEVSAVGLLDIVLVEGTIYTFKLTENDF